MPDVTPTVYKQNADQFAEHPSFSSNTLSLDSNRYTEVFELDIEKGTAALLGRGQSANPNEAQGYVAAHLMDDTSTTAVQITGSWRIMLRTSGSGREVAQLAKGDLEEIDSRDSSNNKLQRGDGFGKPLPVTDDAFATHEYTITFDVKPDSDETIDTSPDSEQTEVYVDGYEMEQNS